MKRDSIISFPLKDKKGVSVMIGYILLVTFAVAIAAIVYQWLNSYVPKEEIQCPDGTSIYISDTSHNQKQLNITIQNNGRFNISGIFIRYSKTEGQDVATNDLSKNLTSESYEYTAPGVRFGSPDENTFAPDQEKQVKFEISGISQMHSIQVTPTRSQTENNQLTRVSCTNAQTESIINMTS
ncbi:MAG: hypothetical protein ABEI74_03995 [Candidatus Pacearchaeota archaeon]